MIRDVTRYCGRAIHTGNHCNVVSGTSPSFCPSKTRERIPFILDWFQLFKIFTKSVVSPDFLKFNIMRVNPFTGFDIRLCKSNILPVLNQLLPNR